VRIYVNEVVFPAHVETPVVSMGSSKIAVE
jgi:hypothetical protein